MDPPVCRTCGKKHWSRLCDGGVTEPVTPAVTKPAPVTRDVTPKLVAPSELKAAQAEVEALRAEVAMLKQKLAEANGTPKLAVSAAERMRKMRAKTKEKV